MSFIISVIFLVFLTCIFIFSICTNKSYYFWFKKKFHFLTVIVLLPLPTDSYRPVILKRAKHYGEYLCKSRVQFPWFFAGNSLLWSQCVMGIGTVTSTKDQHGCILPNLSRLVLVREVLAPRELHMARHKRKEEPKIYSGGRTVPLSACSCRADYSPSMFWKVGKLLFLPLQETTYAYKPMSESYFLLIIFQNTEKCLQFNDL